MPATPRSNERLAQKSRTRAALLSGARSLLSEGRSLTVSAAAARAGISKATAYRYFSDPAVLAAEAGLDVEVLTYAEVIAEAATLRDRLMAINLYFFDLAMNHEAAFRKFLARSLDAWSEPGGPARARRGARRVTMYRQALAEAGDPLPRAAADGLVAALTAATGSEAMIALLDIAGSDRDAARVTVADLSGAVLDRYFGPSTA